MEEACSASFRQPLGSRALDTAVCSSVDAVPRERTFYEVEILAKKFDMRRPELRATESDFCRDSRAERPSVASIRRADNRGLLVLPRLDGRDVGADRGSSRGAGTRRTGSPRSLSTSGPYGR